MIKSSSPHIFLLAIAFIILLLFTIGNCNNNNYDDQMESTLFEKQLIPTNNLNDLLEQENSYDEDARISIRDLIQAYPIRRSSFHAMRGKRQVILP
jgi:hypothetical protein